jgi:hypothetical protein
VPAGPRSPHLFRALRAFCLGAFFELGRELESGADVPVSLEEHGGPNRPTLYEYRPLIGSFVEARAERLGRRDDGTEALIALKDEPLPGSSRRRTRANASGKTRRSAAPSSFRS